MSGGAKETTIYVGNLTAVADEKALRSVFETCGEVVDVRLAGKPGRATIYSFVEFADANAATTALAMDGLQVGEYDIRVKMAHPAAPDVRRPPQARWQAPHPPGASGGTMRPAHQAPPALQGSGGYAQAADWVPPSNGGPARQQAPLPHQPFAQVPQYQQPVASQQSWESPLPWQLVQQPRPEAQWEPLPQQQYPPAQPDYAAAPPQHQLAFYQQPNQRMPYDRPPYDQPPGPDYPPQQNAGYRGPAPGRPYGETHAPQQHGRPSAPGYQQSGPMPSHDAQLGGPPPGAFQQQHGPPDHPRAGPGSRPEAHGRHQPPPLSWERQRPPHGAPPPQRNAWNPREDRRPASDRKPPRRHSKEDPDRAARTVFLSEVETGFDEESIAQFFSNIGAVVAVRMGPADSGVRRAWAELETLEQAQTALKYDQQKLGSTAVRVRPSKSAIYNSTLGRSRNAPQPAAAAVQQANSRKRPPTRSRSRSPARRRRSRSPDSRASPLDAAPGSEPPGTEDGNGGGGGGSQAQEGGTGAAGPVAGAEGGSPRGRSPAEGQSSVREGGAGCWTPDTVVGSTAGDTDHPHSGNDSQEEVSTQ